jgi:glycolate oxidase
VCHLRLRPKRAETTTVAAFFDSVQLAAEASVAIARARIQSDVAELLDPAVLAPSIPCREPTSSRVAAFLLVQTGAGADMEAESVRTAVAGLAARFR